MRSNSRVVVNNDFEFYCRAYGVKIVTTESGMLFYDEGNKKVYHDDKIKCRDMQQLINYLCSGIKPTSEKIMVITEDAKKE